MPVRPDHAGVGPHDPLETTYRALPQPLTRRALEGPISGLSRNPANYAEINVETLHLTERKHVLCTMPLT
jgi:hypothetical protein